ncbi:hypothetical protein GCM10007966_18150 [Legionella impletisoli]|uniref:IraD/Gp25-like domain-containing protein n=1 Tax=Legionella impletisoli TaxID=343510 RepID=A0A917JZ48_9GAMM|nr:hypothetical protein GCM10007966_18150 [Legionella impletisoli]
MLHLPDYGLSEYPIHQGFAEMQKKFVDDLKTVIERFEPRVSSLIIEGITNDTRNGVLQVSIQADLKVMEAINFQAQLLKNGEIRIMGDI